MNIYLKAFAGRITPFQNVYFFAIFLAFYTGLAQIVVPRDLTTEQKMTTADILLTALQDLFIIGYQYLVARASKLESRASIVGMLLNSQVLFAYILDIIVLGHAIDIYNVVGGVIVVVAAVVIAFSREKIVRARADGGNVQGVVKTN